MLLITQTTCIDSKKSLVRERYWIDYYKSQLNINIPSRTKKEYVELHKEKRAGPKKEYRNINKEEVKEYRKEYKNINKEEMKRKNKIYDNNNKEIMNEKQKMYYENNKGKNIKKGKRKI